MSGAARYTIPAARHRTETTIERSRFVCTVAPAATVAAAQQLVRDLNAEFPDASHHCWAYVVGPAGSTGQVGMSDDGEPHGTAGRPMLTVLLHSGIGDIAAVVSRWFGGTKLGTGGLVKAYSGAVQDALVSLPRAERVDTVTMTVTVSYGDIAAMQLLWPRHEVEVVDERFDTEVHFEVRLPREHRARFEQQVRDATRGQATFVAADAGDAT